MGCGCGGGRRAIPLTSGDVAAQIEASGSGEFRFRVVRSGQDDELFATYAAARAASSVIGGVVRTYKPPEG